MPLPENTIKITGLSAGTVKGGSLLATSEPDSSTPPVYSSSKVSAADVADFVATTKNYSGLQTTNKTLVGAINEAAQGGGGSANMTELTQAEYDALEQAGLLVEDMMYFITDGQESVNTDLIDDTTTSASKVWSSQKTNSEISAVAATVPAIDDGSTSASKVWSSTKTNTAITTVASTITEIAKATRTGLSHPTGVSYFTFTALPEKAGYSRMVIGANPSIADILYVRFTEVNGDLRVYMNNTTGSSATYDLTVAVAYIKN